LSRRTLAVVAAIYFVEGFPFGVFRDVWPAYFRTHGVSLQAIGWISGLALAWSLKFLWSPLLDLGDKRRWIMGCLAVMALALLALADLDPHRLAFPIWAVLTLFCVASATQDVAIDAYTIALVPRGEEGPANAARITAYRVGLIAAGGGLLLLPNRVGWPVTFVTAGLLCAALAAGLAAFPRVDPPRMSRPSFYEAFGGWRRRGGAAGVLAFVLLYRLGDSSMAPMLKPFWVDRGMSLEEIGTVSTSLGALATVVGAWAGGAWVARRGIGAALLPVGVLALASNLGYAAVAQWPASGRPGLYAASLTESFCGGLAAAAFMAFLMRICEREHAAVQYACLSALYALPGTAAGVLSGYGVASFGYAATFALTGLLALPALLLVPRARRWADA
jgi:PAT family beta-lactamase induction signal transducer AmpG